jgi:hypothetical protein
MTHLRSEAILFASVGFEMPMLRVSLYMLAAGLYIGGGLGLIIVIVILVLVLRR